MRVPYGADKEYFIYSLFLVFCNRLTTSAVSAGSLLVSRCYMRKTLSCACVDLTHNWLWTIAQIVLVVTHLAVF